MSGTITAAVFGLTGLLLGATTETFIYAASVFDLALIVLWYWFKLIGWTTIYDPYFLSWYIGISWAFSIVGCTIMKYSMDEPPFIRYDTDNKQKMIMGLYFTSFLLTLFLYIHYYTSPHGIWLPIVLALAVIILATLGAMFFYVATVTAWLATPGLNIAALRLKFKYSPVNDWNEKDAKYKWYVLGGMLVLFMLAQFAAYITTLNVVVSGFSVGDLWVNLIALFVEVVYGFVLFFWYPAHK